MTVFRRWFSHLWPIGLLLAVEIVLAATNYAPGTWLMGWDNVMPEFNFRQALLTNIFGAWQEYRGVGLPDGMGHAANLVHTLGVWLMSLVLPQHTLRYAFQFLMHFLGMVGMYTLLGSVIPGLTRDPSSSHKLDSGPVAGMTRVLGALLYGFNFITIQMFYTPLEAFSVHFAALPLLAYSLLLYLQKPHRNTLLLFISISFLTTPQFFIPTLILPTAIVLGCIGGTFAFFHRRHGSYKTLLTAAATFLCVNAFWLLPYLYNLPWNAPVIQRAKINEMTSGEVYDRNRAFGDIGNVISMRGFMLDFEDVDMSGAPIHVMEAWRNWMRTPAATTATNVVVALTLLGVLTMVFDRNARKTHSWILAVWVISLVLLANNTPVLSDVMGAIRNRIPLFAEAYRFPFTKFSLLYGLTASVLAVLGLRMLTNALLTYAHPQEIRSGKTWSTALSLLVVLPIASAILLVSFPAFQGKFFYEGLRANLPQDYINLMNFMNNQDHTGRTSYLPDPSYWSWKHYRFGYVGSGFLWYGLPQPLMDRAFDPWSNVNENYYWEVSYALYRKDGPALDAVFKKYDIRYIILDTYLNAPGSDRSLFTEETTALLAQVTTIKPIGTFGALSVYELAPTTDSFVRTMPLLPDVTPAYQWTDNDVAYQSLGDYMSGTVGNERTVLYPFRSLFTKRAINEREFTIDESASNTLVLRSQIAGYELSVDTADPLFTTDNTQILDPLAVKSCGLLKSGKISAETILETDGSHSLRLTSNAQRACISFGDARLPHAQGYLVKIISRHIAGRPLQVSVINTTAKHVEVETLLGETGEDWQTEYFILPPLAADGLGYSLFFTSDAIGSDRTVNDIQLVSFYPFPYDRLASLTTSAGSDNKQSDTSIASMRTIHPNPSFYDVSLPSHNTDQTLILSQAYQPGWIAVDVSGKRSWQKTLPFVFGKPLPDHLLINNWENGWRLTGNEREIVILFLPQLLQYIGFALGAIPFFFLYVRKHSKYLER